MVKEQPIDTKRDKAITMAFAESGCRFDEILKCRIKDFKLMPRSCEKDQEEQDNCRRFELVV